MQNTIPTLGHAARGNKLAQQPDMFNDAKKAAKAAKLAEQLSLFDSLPDAAKVALPVVCAFTGRSAASVWRDVKAGRLPAPVRCGVRSTRWVVGDLRKLRSA